MTSFKQQLQEQLALATQTARDEARKEGYADGYAAAIRDLQELSSTPHAPLRGSGKKRSIPADYVPSPPRGNNARLVGDVLKSIAPRAAGPTEIIALVKKEAGVELAYSSTRHALNQLVAKGLAEQDGNLAVWKHRSPPANVVGMKR